MMCGRCGAGPSGFDLFDSCALCGLKLWHFNFKWSGVHHRFSLDRQLGRHVDNKTEAEGEAEKIRIAIREGHFGEPVPRAELTLRQLGDTYEERYVQAQRAGTAAPR